MYCIMVQDSSNVYMYSQDNISMQEFPKQSYSFPTVYHPIIKKKTDTEQTLL